MTKILKFV